MGEKSGVGEADVGYDGLCCAPLDWPLGEPYTVRGARVLRGIHTFSPITGEKQ